MLNTPKYSGEPTPQALASGLATLGRYGDEFMVHAAEGETVIPPEIFEANPQLKADLFRQMAMMGIKDPNRYVVGNSLNSINPLTGQPEFFFKKIFKSIKKVFKKALPIIAPILGNLILPGIGGILASGLVTKLQGGSWGDVLKGAAIGWATQGLTSGIGGAMSAAPGQGFSGFTSGLTKGLSAPFTAASNLFSSGPANPFSQGIFGSSRALAGAGMFGKTLTPQYNPLAGSGGITTVGPQVGAVTSGAGPVTSAAGQPVGAFNIENSDFGAAGSIPDFGAPTASSFGDGFNIEDPTGGGNVKLQTFSPPPAQINPQVSAASGDGFVIDGNEQVPAGSIPEISASPASTDQDLLASFDANTEGPRYGLEPATEPPRLVDRTVDYAGKKLQQGVDYFDPTPEAAMERAVGRYKNALKFQNDALIANDQAPLTVTQSNALYKKMVLDPGPESLISRSMPLIAAAGAGYAAYDAYSEEEAAFNAKPNKPALETIAYDKWREVKDKDSPEAQEYFKVWNGPAYITRKQYEKQTGGPSIWQDWRFLPEESESYAGYDQTMGKTVGLLPADLRKNRVPSGGIRAAMGGEVVGPGTGTSDSIPARLSDGEFVMTADAVRNAGGGSRDLGAARMYDMMRRFEGGVA